MDESDEEVFWGPVTARELKIILKQIFPVSEPENSEIRTSTVAGSVSLDSSPVNSCNSTNENVPSCDISQTHSLKSSCTIPEVMSSADSSTKQYSCRKYQMDFEPASSNENLNKEMEATNEVVFTEFSDVLHSSQTEKDKSEKSEICNFEMNENNPSKDNISNLVNSSESSGGEIFNQGAEEQQPIKLDLSAFLSSDGSYSSTDSNGSKLLKSVETGKADGDLCMADRTRLSTFSSLTNDCSVNTQFSNSSGIFSNVSESMQLSFDGKEVQLLDRSDFNSCAGMGYNTVTCDRSVTEPVLLTPQGSWEACNSVYSNISAEKNFQMMHERSNVNRSDSLDTTGISIQSENLPHSNPNVPGAGSQGTSTALENMKTKNQNSFKDKKSKIPIPSNQSPASNSSEKNLNNEPSANPYCGNSCPQNNVYAHIHSPMSSADYMLNSDNLVMMTPEGNVVPTLLYGSRVHSSTSLSANYVHVMNYNSPASVKKSFDEQSNQPNQANSGLKEEDLSSESNEIFNSSEGYDKIEAMTDSVLCTSLLDSSSESSSLNNTLEECELMMKFGYEYMCSSNDFAFKQDTNRKSRDILSHVKSEPEQKTRPKGLEPCQYIRSSHEELNSHILQKELKEDLHFGAVSKTPGTRSFPFKTASASCPRTLQRLKKTTNFSDIRSPVAAYIKDRPVQLIKTAGRVKPCGKNKPSRNLGQDSVGNSIKQAPASTLPEIVYEKAPGFKINQSRSVEHCGQSKLITANPMVIRHAGRAVLATVPQNALQMKNAEVSVLYDKDASKTNTLQ